MEFSEYQRKSRETAIYPDLGKNFIYPALGLAGETGEVLEKIKKALRDERGVVSEERRAQIEKELGDVLWYMAQLCTELGLDLDRVARRNLEKLLDRKKRGKLHGEGDNR